VATIEQELQSSRDVLSILEHFKKNVGAAFAAELDVVTADMRSSSYEAALTRFEARLNSSQLSDVVRGLIGVLRGDDSAVYFQMLAHDFKALELQHLKSEAQKIPPRSRVFSFIMLMCFLFTYVVIITASMSITPDAKVPTASGEIMKSGYGVNQVVNASVSTNQSPAVTEAQTAVTYFPESAYQTYWRLLNRTTGGYNAKFEFEENVYSTYYRLVHFTPVWLLDGNYTPYNYLLECWTPAGMLSKNLSDSVTVSGSLWSDWHIAPVNP
jgi:hypothetical protein